jgi:hypothetical protein
MRCSTNTNTNTTQVLAGDLHGVLAAALSAGGILPTAIAAAGIADIGPPLEYVSGPWAHAVSLALIAAGAAAGHMLRGAYPAVGTACGIAPGLWARYLCMCALERTAPRFLTRTSAALALATLVAAAVLPEIGLPVVLGGAVGGVASALLATPLAAAAAAAARLTARAAGIAAFLLGDTALFLAQFCIQFVRVTLRAAAGVATEFRGGDSGGGAQKK